MSTANTSRILSPFASLDGEDSWFWENLISKCCNTEHENSATHLSWKSRKTDFERSALSNFSRSLERLLFWRPKNLCRCAEAGQLVNAKAGRRRTARASLDARPRAAGRLVLRMIAIMACCALSPRSHCSLTSFCKQHPTFFYSLCCLSHSVDTCRSYISFALHVRALTRHWAGDISQKVCFHWELLEKLIKVVQFSRWQLSRWHCQCDKKQ